MIEKISIRNVQEVTNFLESIPRGATKLILDAFATYIIGNTQRGLRHNEPQKYISRKQAGYKTSQKQMAFFFANKILVNVGGQIQLNHYKRTGATAAAWYAKETKGGYGRELTNNLPGAYYTRDNKHQTRQHALAGRRKVAQVIIDNLGGAFAAARAAVSKLKKDKGNP